MLTNIQSFKFVQLLAFLFYAVFVYIATNVVLNFCCLNMESQVNLKSRENRNFVFRPKGIGP